MKIRLTLILLAFTCCHVLAQEPKKSETVSINGKSIYYEVYGSGEPLILLHGYSLSSTHWIPYLAEFESDYEVYIIDLPGHGQSSPFSDKLSIPEVGKDLNALLTHLNLKEAYAIGFSFGGDILFQLALQNPDALKSMITIGAVGSWNVKHFPEYLDAFTFENKDEFPWLEDSHSSDVQIKGIMDQFKNYRVRLSNKALKSIEPEVLIVLGDEDEGISLDAAFRARKLLSNSDLWILPNVSHSAHEGAYKEPFIKAAKAFFNKH